MDIGQGSGSRYTFEKHYFNQQHVRLNFARLFVGNFQKIIIFIEPDFKYFTPNQKIKPEIKWSASFIVFEWKDNFSAASAQRLNLTRNRTI